MTGIDSMIQLGEFFVPIDKIVVVFTYHGREAASIRQMYKRLEETTKTVKCIKTFRGGYPESQVLLDTNILLVCKENAVSITQRIDNWYKLKYGVWKGTGLLVSSEKGVKNA